MIGKYFNGYGTASYIPPGWDHWTAFTGVGGNGTKYYNYSLSADGVATSYGSASSDYSTHVLSSKAEAFIRAASPDQPFFLYFTPNAPHEPATPAARHATSFSNLPAWRPPSYNEADVSDVEN